MVPPECWDGKHLGSADHRSHMAYADASLVCPPSHPVQVPGLTLVIAYPIYDGRTFELSSGGQLSAHGDFFNAWDQRILARLAAACSAPTARADCADRIHARM